MKGVERCRTFRCWLAVPDDKHSMSKVHFGIDIGTSSCSVAYVVDDPRVRNHPIVPVKVVGMPIDDAQTESNRMPSILGIDWANRSRRSPLFGWAFWRPFQTRKRSSALLRRGVEYLASVKSDMGTYQVYPRSLIPGARTPGQATAEIIKRLAEAVRREGRNYDLPTAHTTITVPASFSSLAREETLQAAEEAGLDRSQIELVDEPVAALVDLLNDPGAAHVLSDRYQNVLVFDYGAGTCDLSLVRARFNASAKNGLEVQNLAISPYRRLGGDDIDAEVMRQVVWPELCDHNPEFATLDEPARRALEDTLTPTVARGLKEAICRTVAAKVKGTGNWRNVNSDLSVTYSLSCQFTAPKTNCSTPVRFRITAGQFQAVMAPFLAVPADDGTGAERSLLVPVMQTLRRANLSPDELDALVLHGGSSLNPYVAQMLEDNVGRAGFLFSNLSVHRTPEPLTSVARGAALVGYWKHARAHDYVKPIVAEEIGLLVIGNEPKRLVSAGESLPYPDDDGVEEVTAGSLQFVVPSDNQPELLVPVYTGQHWERRISATIKVPLADGTRAGDSVRIKLRIDRDKTLHWWFSVGGRDFEEAASVTNPWILRTPSLNERRLLDHRMAMRKLVENDSEVAYSMQWREASLLHRASHLQSALALTRDLITAFGERSELANLEGLIQGDMGNREAALEAYKRAAELEPNDPVLVGNYGAQLAELGQLSLAVPMLRRAISINPQLAYVHVFLSDVMRRLGDETGAERELNQAITILERQLADNPLDVDVWRELAHARESLGQYELAQQARRAATDIVRNELFGGDSNAVIASAGGRRTWRNVE